MARATLSIYAQVGDGKLLNLADLEIDVADMHASVRPVLGELFRELAKAVEGR